MSRYKIGIDPGVTTGLAVWDSKEGVFVHIDQTSILNAMRYVLRHFDWCDGILYIEDARMRSGARHKAQGAGSIKRDCSIWQEFCEMEKLPHVFLKPGRGTKLPPEVFAKSTGWTGKASTHKTWHHARDAAILVFGR